MNTVEKSFAMLTEKISKMTPIELKKQLEQFKNNNCGPTIKEFLNSKKNNLTRMGQHYYVSKTSVFKVANNTSYKPPYRYLTVKGDSLHISHQETTLKHSYKITYNKMAAAA